MNNLADLAGQVDSGTQVAGVQFDLADIEARCRTSLDTFASVCMPETIEFAFPEYYQIVWAFLVQALYTLRYPEQPVPDSVKALHIRRVFRFALGLPRGHAKTTFIKLLVCFGLLYDLIDFVLVVCSTEPRAYDFLSDINDILLSSNIKSIYGSWHESMRKDTLSLKRGKLNGKDKIIAAIGSGTAIRGLNIGNDRPDCILFDDAQTESNAASPQESQRLLQWIVGTAIKTRNMRKCFIGYIGNMYNTTCILHRFKDSASWYSLITGGILADGTALWQELIPLETLLDDYQNDASLGLAHVWFAEVQNDPIGARKSLLEDGLPPPIEYLDIEVLGAFLTIDPAGHGRKSDANTITVHLLLTDNRLVIPEILVLQGAEADPEKVILAAIGLAIRYDVSAIFPEGVAYQQTLAFWLEKYLAEHNLAGHLIVEPINPGSVSKSSRILAYIASIRAGSSSIVGTVARNLFAFQAHSYDFSRSDNADDILDGCAMGELVRASKLHLVHLRSVSDNIVPISVAYHNTPIDAYKRRSAPQRG